MSQNNGQYGVTNDEIMEFLKENMVMRSEFEQQTKHIARIEQDVADLRFNMSQLSAEVKEFIMELRRNDGEIATLNARCFELEKKVAYLEQKLQAA